MNRFILCGALLSAAACVPVSWAQTPPASSMALASSPVPSPAVDPLDARSPVPRLSLRSSLSDYRLHKDAAVGPWRQLNDTVRDVGGWKTYARLSQEPDGAEDVKSSQGVPTGSPTQTEEPKAADQKPASGAHAGHGR